jgi:transcriptional regulator with XRE-family HTH domain
MFLRVSRSSVPDPALAAVVRRLREERGMTQEALAFASGVTTGSIARIELVQSVPGWDTVRSIAKALGVRMAELGAAIDAER